MFLLRLVVLLLNYLRYPLVSFFDAAQMKPSAVLLAVWGNVGLGRDGTLYLLSGTNNAVASVMSVLVGCVGVGLIFSFVFTFWRLILRRTWAAVIVIIILAAAVNSMGNISFLSLILVVISIGTILYVLLRYGLLALMATLFFFNILLAFPITINFSDSFFSLGFMGLVILLAFALYAFYTSLGGHPIFGTPRLDD